MASDIRRAIVIDFQAKGNLPENLNKLVKLFDTLLKSTSKSSEFLTPFLRDISNVKVSKSFLDGMDKLVSMGNLKLPNISKFVEGAILLFGSGNNAGEFVKFTKSLLSLNDVKVPSLAAFAKSVTSLTSISSNAELAKLISDLAKIQKLDVSKLSAFSVSINSFAKSTDKLTSASEKISVFINSISRLSEIKTTNISDLSSAIDKLLKSTGASGGRGGSASQLDKIISTLEKLSGVKIPNFQVISSGILSLLNLPVSNKSSNSLTLLSDLINIINRLNQVKIPNLNTFADGIKKLFETDLSRTQNTQGLENFLTTITRFSGIRLPNIKNLADGIASISSIGSAKIPSFTWMDDLLNQITKLGNVKIPNINTLATGIRSILALSNTQGTGNFSSLQSIISLVEKLNGLKVPNLQKLYEGLNKLSQFSDSGGKVSTNLNGLSQALSRLQGLTVPDVSKLVSGLQKLITLDINAVVLKVTQLSQALAILDKSGHLKSFATFANDLRNISANLGNVIGPLSKIQKSVSGLDTTLKSAGRSTREFGERFVNYLQYRIIADTMFMIQDAVKSGVVAIKDFDQALHDLQAISGASSAEIASIGKEIVNVSKATKFSTMEIADGAKTLMQAGFSARETIQALGPISQLATGTLSDLKSTIDLVTTALRVFEKSASETGHVTDVMATAINKSKLNIDKLRTAFNYVGPVARSANVSLEETAGTMMVLANSGLRASTIGTSLRRLFSDLSAPSRKFKEAIEEAGFAVEEFDPLVNSLADIFQKLNVVIPTAGDAFRIFGKLGASAALALKNQNSGFTDMVDAVNQSGEASRMAITQAEGLGVMFKNLKDRIELLAIAMGDAGLTTIFKGFVSAARGAVAVIDTLINSGLGPLVIALGSVYTALVLGLLTITKTGAAWAALTFAMKNNIQGAVSLLSTHKQLPAIFVAMSSGLYTMIGWFKSATQAVYTMVTANLALTAALGPVVIALAALAAGTIYLISSMDDLKKASEAAFERYGEIETLREKLDQYYTSVVNLRQGTKELTTANVNLRKELFEVASGNAELYASAIQAALAIDPLTGAVLDGGKALELYNKQLKEISFAELTSSMNNAFGDMLKQTSALNRGLEYTKIYLGDIGRSIVSSSSAGLFPSLAGDDFENEFKRNASARDTETEIFGRPEGTTLAADMAKALQEGTTSWEEFSSFVADMRQRTQDELSALSKDLIAVYDNINKVSTEIINKAIESGDIDISIDAEGMRAFGQEAGLATEHLGLFVDIFQEYQKQVKAAQPPSLGENLVREYAYGKEAVADFIDQYEELGGVLSSVQKKNVEEIEEQWKELSRFYQQIEKDFDLRKAQGADGLTNTKLRVAAEEEFIARYREINKQGYDDFTYHSLRTLKRIKEDNDEQINLLNSRRDRNYISESKYYEELAKLAVNYSKKVKQSMISVYSVDEIQKRYQTELKEMKLMDQNKLHQIALSEASQTMAHDQAEKERYQITLDSYNKQLQAVYDYAEKVKAASDTTPEEQEAADQSYIDVARQRTEFLRKELVKQIAEEKKAQNEIAKINNRTEAEIIKNKTNLAKSHLKYTQDIEKAELALEKKLESIDKARQRRVDKINKDIAKSRRITASNVQEIATSGEDIERDIKQRKKSPKQIEIENTAVAWRKLREGEKLIEEARRENDEETLSRGEQLVNQAMSIAQGLEKEANALRLVRTATNDLIDAEKVRGDIDVYEREQDIIKAEDTASDEIDSATREFDARMELLDEEFAEKARLEADRHEFEMANLDTELAKWKEKVTILQQMLELSKSIAENLNTEVSQVEAARQQITGEGPASSGYGWMRNNVTGEVVGTPDGVGAAPQLVPEPLSGLEALKNMEMFIDLTNLEDVQNKLGEMGKMEVGIEVTGKEDLESMAALLDTFTDKDKEVKVEAKVEGEEEATKLQETITALMDKAVTATATIKGIDEGEKLQGILAGLQDKTITITTKYVTSGSPSGATTVQTKAVGGAIQPVFKRLVSRYITAGSGLKDDVPILAKKDEFVHKVAAVKRYGKKFMYDVNEGRFPLDLAKGYFEGGVIGKIGGMVQKFAKGGRVMPIRKRITDFASIVEDTTNIGNVNIFNDAKALSDQIVSPIGVDYFNNTINHIGNNLASFLTGGVISSKSGLNAKELNDIVSQYNVQIKLANDMGREEVAKALQDEKNAVTKLANLLKKSLRDIEARYRRDMAAVNKESLSEEKQLEQDYKDQKQDDESDYKQQVAEDSLSYAQEDHGYELSEAERKEDYDDSVNKINDELPEQVEDYEEELADLLEAIEILKKEDEDYRKKHYSSWAYPKSSPKLLTDPIEDILTQYFRSSVKFSEIDSSTGRSYTTKWQLGKPNKKRIEKALKEYKSTIGDDLEDTQESYEDLLKEDPREIAENELAELKKNFEEEQAAADLDRSRSLFQREKSIFERDKSYKVTRMNADLAYARALAELRKKKEEEEKEVQDTYETDVADTQEDTQNKMNDVQENTNRTLQEKNRDLITFFEKRNRGGSNRSSISSIYTNINPTLDAGKLSTTTVSQDIKEIMKKLSRGAMKFARGGVVPLLNGSTLGEDSILSWLAPKEFVVKAKAVRAYGTNFLDKINNMQIPKFNQGGLVGGAMDSVNVPPATSSSSSTVRHVLDFRYDGTKVAEFESSKTDIDAFINIMEKAKRGIS